MARIRSIKPGFFTSPDIARLSVRARLTFIGLWTHVDDDGRCLYEPRLIHASLYPLDDEVTVKKVHADLMELENAGLTASYEVHDRRFLEITNWHHQKISHKTPSTHPPNPNRPAGQPVSDSGAIPESNGKAHETLRPDMDLDRDREHQTAPTDSVLRSEFERWWTAYPRKVGKKDALKAYRRARREVDATRLVAGAEREAAKLRAGTEPKFIPHPATWLNGGRWEDEPDRPLTAVDDNEPRGLAQGSRFKAVG